MFCYYGYTPTIALISVVALIIAILAIVYACYKAENKKLKGSNVVKNLKLFLVLGVIFLVLSIFLITISIIAFDNSAEIWSIIVMSLVICAISIWLIMLAINYKIEVFDDYIIYHNLFNKKNIYYFKDIEIRYSYRNYKIVKFIKLANGGEKVKTIGTIAGLAPNAEFFFEKYKKYKIEHNQQIDLRYLPK